MSIALPARAKLNLDLAILGRRPDGFHDVHTTLQAIDLHDLITLMKSEQTTLTASGLPITNQGENSVLKALAALEQATNRPLPTRIHLHKRIPPGSGMGGASSDAASTLKALANLHHVTADLKAVAAALGADVPFFLTGGTAVADQRGDHLTPIHTQPQWFAIAWPGVELPTPAVYRAWDAMKKPPGNEPNQLTGAAMSIEPSLREFANALNSHQPGWQMTGSGSAFFLRCAGERAAVEAVAGLKSLNCWTAIAQSVGTWD
ncbi:MAG TPA: 4-(cytidine 5'-diphospho)-2-C-methyl-D-erythritol kinase [Candidatus Dormibacteraeota bacterium]|nr:4-(cytidine 5'-diphospho)-2-C-methyl-D-erythritol kinase [Candidatus Dormibacteraeota bacterium]